MAEKTLPPLLGLFFATGFLLLDAVDGIFRDAAVAQADPVEDDAAAGFFFLLCCFNLAIQADFEAFTRASNGSSSSNQPLLEIYCFEC